MDQNAVILNPSSPSSDFSSVLSVTGAPVTYNPSNLSLANPIIFAFGAAIMIIIAIAFVMFLDALIIRLKGSAAAYMEAKNITRRQIIGLASALLLVPAALLFNKDLIQVGWTGLKATSAGVTNTITQSYQANATTTSSTPIPQTTQYDAMQAIKDDPLVRKQLASLPNGGITVNKQVCTIPTQTGCTTVGGLPPSTLTMLSQLRAECSGSIAITGGVEAGHKSHGPGLRPVDLSMTQPGGLNECIRAFPPGPPLSFCYKTYQKFGYVFCDEISVPRHWHVQ